MKKKAPKNESVKKSRKLKTITGRNYNFFQDFEHKK